MRKTNRFAGVCLLLTTSINGVVYHALDIVAGRIPVAEGELRKTLAAHLVGQVAHQHRGTVAQGQAETGRMALASLVGDLGFYLKIEKRHLVFMG